MSRSGCSLVALSLLALSACAGEQAVQVAAPGTSPQDDGAVHDWLVGEEVPVRTALQAVPDPVRLEDSLVQDEPRYKVGLAVPLDAEVSLAGIDARDLSRTLEVAGGAIRASGPTGFVWSAQIEAPGAAALRLEIVDLSLPAGAELYAYGSLGDVSGPFTGSAERLHTNALRGDSVWLQLRYDGVDTDAALDAVAFEVFDVGYLDERFQLAKYRRPGEPDYREFCSFNDTCIDNAECFNEGAVAIARLAVADMLFASGPWYYICTGGLLDNAANLPLFLTANHCISSGNEANSLETYFGYTTACDGNYSNNDCDLLAQPISTLGSSIASSSSSNDHTLLQLAQDPGRPGLSWNPNAISGTNGAQLHRVSHPQGAPQAYSAHVVDTSAGTCGGLPRGRFIYSRDTSGGTEGGSSGSPVVDSSGAVVGQLYGACGFNPNDACDSASNATVDGAFADYYPSIASLLTGGSGCTDNDGDGYCPEDGDCDDGDPNVNPGEAELCDNGIDDNCNGQIDEGCAQCLDRGATCSSNADCCSNKCKGKRNKHCR